MRSIRQSLILYFLLLTTGALAAVSWFSYRTTTVSLRERERDSRMLIEAQCETNCKAVRDDFDRRLRQQALRLASLSQSMYVHAESQFALFGMIGAAALPNGHVL